MLFVPAGWGFIAEILPSVHPRSAGICWKESQNSPLFQGGGGLGEGPWLQMTSALSTHTPAVLVNTWEAIWT